MSQLIEKLQNIPKIMFILSNQCLLLFALLFASGLCLADSRVIITNDGREILLNDDGTWQYHSTDRFANTKDGRRIRLKQDGSWLYLGNTLLKTKQQVTTSTLDIKLQKVVVETYKVKTQKSSRIKTQTVFYLAIKNSLLSKVPLNISANTSLLAVSDNNGKNYDVISLRSNVKQLLPGEVAKIVVRAKKSPLLWDNVKSMQLLLKPELFAIKKPVMLGKQVIDFQQQNVDGFE